MLIASLREVIQKQAQEIESLQARLTAAEQKAPPPPEPDVSRHPLPSCYLCAALNGHHLYLSD